MNASRRNIERLIQKSEHEIFEMVKAIDMKSAYIQGLRDTLKYLPKEADPGGAPVALRAGTDLAKAYEAIRKAGKPLHVLDLVKALGKEPTKKNRISLSGSIGFYVRRNQFFTRPAPNTFGVAEFADDSALTNGEPPENFGIEEEKAEIQSRPSS